MIGVGSGPDLVVASIYAPPSAAGPFALAAAVCNQGSQPSPATEVRFYTSADASITGSLERPRAADVLIGTRAIGPLQPGQCDRQPTTATPPAGSGAFFLGAIVDEAGQIAELIACPSSANPTTCSTGRRSGSARAPTSQSPRSPRRLRRQRLRILEDAALARLWPCADRC
jgi:hypothetical protein